MASVQDQPGVAVDDERPGKDARRPEQIRHARLALRRRALVPVKVGEPDNGQTRSNVVRPTRWGS